jgi:predicted transposase/invertase (TIGR01784 family)
MTDVLRYVFLELGRFKKHIWELETTFDKWMYLLRHMHEMVEIPEIFQTSEFKRLFILAEIGNFTASELKEYENSLTSMSDYYNIIDSAEKRAREEGREEGLAEAARKMLASGIALEVVADILQLPVEQLKEG